MSQKSFQSSNVLVEKESSDLNVNFLRCSIKGHNNLQLKFISKREYPNISHIYCPICLKRAKEHINLNEMEIVSLDDVFEDTVSLTQKYMAEIEPAMAKLQAKHEQMAKNDFKSMFQSVISKRERFRKTIQGFKMEISRLCQQYEEFFEKKLEAQFYQSFFSIESRLSSFKDSFEILRLRLNSYNQELEKSLSIAQDIPQFCQNVSRVLQDFNSLQSNNLLKLMTNGIDEYLSNNSIVENFNANYAIEKELSSWFSSILEKFSDKIDSLQKELIEDKKKPNDESKKEINSKEVNQGKKAVKKDKKAPQQVWADPADESIEIFEREIAKFYQGDLIKKLLKEIEKEEAENNKLQNQEENEIRNQRKENEVKEPAKASKEVKEENSTKKEGPLQNRENVKENNKGKTSIEINNAVDIEEKIQKIMENGDSDENYISEEEDDEGDGEDKGVLHRELIYRIRNNVQPEIFTRLFKSRKYLRKSDRHLRLGIVKFSQTSIDKNPRNQRREDINDDEEGHCISFATVTNKDKGNYATHQVSSGTKYKDTIESKDKNSNDNQKLKGKESQGIKESKKISNKNATRKEKIVNITTKDPLMDFISQLKKETANPDAFQSLQKLMRQIKLNSIDKNKRLVAEDILAIQNFIGEFLRQNNIKNLLEYRKKRRQFNDNDEAMKYNYVCRDFFVKYYNHYKSIKSMFLEELGISKKTFNSGYKYWVENGHNYLTWSRFKSKIQKATVIESKQIIKSSDLKGILNQLLYFVKDPFGEFKEDIVKTKKKERYLLVELLLARVYDSAFFAFQIEEEDILASLKVCSGPHGKEAQKLYEEFEGIIANIMYPGSKIQVNYEDMIDK